MVRKTSKDQKEKTSFIILQKHFNYYNYFQSYTRFNVIDTENAKARNSRSKISIPKLDIVLGYHH